MAKIAKLLFLIVLLSGTLCATNYQKELLTLDNNIKKHSGNELLRDYHRLKSIYIQSIVKDDALLKEETLKRLVKSSNKLKIDSKSYAKELKTMQKLHSSKKTKDTIKKKTKTNVVKKKVIQKKIIKKSNHLSLLKSIKYKQDRLLLTFDKNLKKKDIKSFSLNRNNSYREIFDIEAVLSYTPKIKIPSLLKDLRVAQFNTKVLRVVFQKEKASKSTIVIKDKTVSILYNVKQKKKKSYEKYVKLATPSKIIVIDAGHGGKDAGAVGSKSEYEKRVVLMIALKTGRVLKKRGYKVYYTRTKDKFIKLRNRTKYANNKNADLFLSIHANASTKSSMHGVETFFLSPARSSRSKKVAAKENKSDILEMDYFSKQTFLNVFNREKIIQANKLALDVQQGMLNRLKSKYGGIRDGGVREAPFWVLVGAQMPSILIEAGYISNKKERKRIFNYHYQNLMANGIADGIDSYFIKNSY